MPKTLENLDLQQSTHIAPKGAPAHADAQNIQLWIFFKYGFWLLIYLSAQHSLLTMIITKKLVVPKPKTTKNKPKQPHTESWGTWSLDFLLAVSARTHTHTYIHTCIHTLIQI